LLDFSQAEYIYNLENEVRFLKQENQLMKEQRRSHPEVIQETRNQVICAFHNVMHPPHGTSHQMYITL